MAGSFPSRIDQMGFALKPRFLRLLQPVFTGKTILNGSVGGIENEEARVIAIRGWPFGHKLNLVEVHGDLMR